MSVESNVTSTPETLPQNYSILLLTYIDNAAVKTKKALSYPPDSSWDFDYMIRILVRKFYLPKLLLNKALSAKPNLLERRLIAELGEEIHSYGCLLTDFSYGWRLGHPDKPHEILISLSDEYIEDLCLQLSFVQNGGPLYDSVILMETRERMASLMQHWEKEGYFSNEDLAWIAHVGRDIINWVDLKDLRYAPKSPRRLTFKLEAFYSHNPFGWAEHLAQLSFYRYYMTLFFDIMEHGIIKMCPVCTKFFSRPKSEKRYFDPQIYCCPQCQKKAADHRYYEKRKEELRLERREDMRSIRKCYKDHGLSYDKKVRGTI